MAKAVKLDIIVLEEEVTPVVLVTSYSPGENSLPTRGLDGESFELADPDAGGLAEALFAEYPDNGDPSP